MIFLGLCRYLLLFGFGLFLIVLLSLLQREREG